MLAVPVNGRMEAAFRQSGVGTTPGARHALGAAGELCRAAVVAAATGQFVLRDTVLQFSLAAAGGVAIGLAAGALKRGMLTATRDAFIANG